VYRNFASLEDFEGEIALLRALPSNATTATKNATKVTTPAMSSQDGSSTVQQKTGK
jgi:transcriptional repressor NrdR